MGDGVIVSFTPSTPPSPLFDVPPPLSLPQAAARARTTRPATPASNTRRSDRAREVMGIRLPGWAAWGPLTGSAAARRNEGGRREATHVSPLVRRTAGPQAQKKAPSPPFGELGALTAR